MNPAPPSSRVVLIVALHLALGGCATSGTAPAPSKVGDAGQDALGLLGPETPAVLAAVSAHPYADPPSACAELWSEVAALDAVLGADVDAPAPSVTTARRVGDAAMGAVAGAVPYRGVLRWMSGAGRKERARARAVLAGTARRGFLKGLALARACPPPPQVG